VAERTCSESVWSRQPLASSPSSSPAKGFYLHWLKQPLGFCADADFRAKPGRSKTAGGLHKSGNDRADELAVATKKGTDADSRRGGWSPLPQRVGGRARPAREATRRANRASLRALGGSGASEMYEVLTWLAYTIAAVVILGATTVAILAGLALRFVAAFLRDLGASREDGDSEEGRRDRGS